MFQRKHFSLFLGVYAALRVFSYFFGPETPLQPQHALNTILAAWLLFTAAYWLAKKDIRGWYVVALELLLGGSGGFLSLSHLTLRTWLLVVSLTIFTVQHLASSRLFAMLRENMMTSMLLCMLLSIAGLQALHGYYNGHDLHLIFADIIPYLFFGYYFPLREIIPNKNFQALALNALAAAIVGNVVFVLLTFVGFSSELFALQGAYYHWFRDVAEGKITELPFHFYRLVLNEHLLLVPVLLYFISKTIKQELAGIYLLLPAALLLTLSMNLTRIYMVALAIGLLVLFRPAKWRNWLKTSVLALLFFSASFTAIHFVASRGASLGWEIFGVRLQSIVSPTIEDSSLSRLLLLPRILEKIQDHAFFGAGLADTATVFSPVFKQTIATPYFDWGYLEILDELGAFGLLTWFVLVGFIFISFYKKSQAVDWQRASLLSLLAINVTSPALFHVLGVVLLTTLLCLKADA